MERVMVIVNPKSGMGKGARCTEEIRRIKEKVLKTAGKELDLVKSVAEGENSIQELIRRAKEENRKEVIVVGGDGAVNAAANILCGSNISLGIIPAGVGNDLSKGLLIPQSTKAALDVALFGKEIRIDLGLLDDKLVFVNVVSFGFDARIVQDIPTLKEKYRFLSGEWLYLVFLLRELSRRIEYPRISVFSEDGTRPPVKKLENNTLALVISNGPQYGGKFKIWPGASLTDGLLNVCWIAKMDKPRILWNLIKFLRGVHDSLPEVDMFTTDSLLVSSLTELTCQIDGEPYQSKKEYKISTLPRALKVKVPRTPEVPIVQ